MPKYTSNQSLYSTNGCSLKNRKLTDNANTLNGMVKTNHTKLQPRKARLFRIIKVQSHTVVGDEEDVQNLVSIHRATAGPGLKEQRP